jgi:hypothetical protein
MNEPAITPNREMFDELGQVMKGLQKAEVPVTHIQTPGLYIRQVEIKAGTKILSARHKTEHPFVISKGKILVVTEEGRREVLEAPHIGITFPGTRRALTALQDTIWTTFHPTAETEIEKITESLVEHETDQDLLQWQESTPKLNEPCHL